MIRIPNLERGAKVPNGYGFLRSPVTGWVDRLVQYHRVVKRQHQVDDWPFWYGERPLLGFLSAGFWGPGVACIEEYSTNKKAESVPEKSQPRKRTRLGRGDLYFSARGTPANIEFKLHDFGISQTDHFADSLKSRMDASKKDARNSHQAGIGDYAGIFLRPYIGTRRTPELYEENLRILLSTIWDKLEPSALAWWCPVREVLRSDRKTENVILGAMMILKEV